MHYNNYSFNTVIMQPYIRTSVIEPCVTGPAKINHVSASTKFRISFQLLYYALYLVPDNSLCYVQHEENLLANL